MPETFRIAPERKPFRRIVYEGRVFESNFSKPQAGSTVAFAPAEQKTFAPKYRQAAIKSLA